VVGINGLGKTTFLTMLYRGLLGPFDQSKSDDVGLLGSQHELSGWRGRGYFRDRVSDGAKEATVELDVQFGKRLLTVRRSLSNLQIDYLALDGSEIESSHETSQDTVSDLSGTASFFDFFAILRYLVFYLEDRVELMWDRRSQFDMLRVLLFDKPAALAASAAYDEAQAADSRFRNRRFILGKDRDRLKDLEAKAGDAGASQFRALQTAVAAAEELDREQASQIEETREKVEEARLRREKALLDLQEARTALEYEEQAHYKHLFPNLGETAQHVFLNLLSGGGCLVCGSVGEDVSYHLRAKLEEHRCPICDSPSERHETIVAPADFSRARLKRLKAKVDRQREAVDVATQEIEDADAEYEKLVDRREEDRQNLRGLRLEMNSLGFSELPTDADIESLRVAVAEGEKELLKLQADRTAAENKYGRVVKKQKGIVDRAVNTIRKRFKEYASLVLAERCELNITKENRSIGQEGARFEFPYFEVMMTSGVFDQSLSTRHNKDAVSESQREFLDIAFRLALISAVTAEKADSMLVFETPESSLDSLFVSMAGEAFRHFGENKKRHNVLIASTNLNNEEMLSALLGVRRAPSRERESATQPKLRPSRQKVIRAPIVPAAARKGRIVNLLELAAPNAALRQHRQYYNALFEHAVHGDEE
jgi:rubrerythrin